MGRTGWWYQVSRDIYPETKTSYGQDLRALEKPDNIAKSSDEKEKLQPQKIKKVKRKSSPKKSMKYKDVDVKIFEEKSANDFSSLSDNQKTFIKNKIRELGSIEKVKIFYNMNSTVGYFAREVAEVILTESKNSNTSFSNNSD